MTIDAETFRVNMVEASRKFRLISEATLTNKVITVDMPTAKKQGFGNQNSTEKTTHQRDLRTDSRFCRSTKHCSDKFIHRAQSSRGPANHYRLCQLQGNCNQQTRERNLGKVQP